MEGISWRVIGLSEVRRGGEGNVSLEKDYVIMGMKGDRGGGTGFLNLEVRKLEN